MEDIPSSSRPEPGHRHAMAILDTEHALAAKGAAAHVTEKRAIP
jgi:hypothetical protein